MIFSTNSPLSQYYDSPDFATGATAKKLAILGYKQNGIPNTWGKISSWIPGVNMALNKFAENTAEKGGAADTMTNVQQDFDNRLNKTALEVGVAGAALGIGGATGAIGGKLGEFAAANADTLIGQGLNMGTQFGGALAFDQNDLVTEGQSIYR